MSHPTDTADRSQKDGHCRTDVRCQLGLFHFAPTNRINSEQKSRVFWPPLQGQPLALEGRRAN